MSGQGTRFQKAGYQEPKPLIPVSGQPMIRRVLQNFPSNWPTHFVLAENHLATTLPQLLKELRPTGTLSTVAPHQEGPLRAIEAALDKIPERDAVFVSYCDYGMVWDSLQFERFVFQTECDACLVSYRGFHAHYLGATSYAYSRMEGERVREVREKGSFTKDRENEFASAGGYYFKSAKILAEAIRKQRELDLKINGEFYTSLTVQALLEKQPDAHVRIFEVPGFFQWGTPDDLRRFEYWEKTYAAYNKISGQPQTAHVSQVLMPMAGLGSRFKGATSYAKPLIPIGNQPMYRAALQTLPQPKNKLALVGLKDFEELLTQQPWLESTNKKSQSYVTETKFLKVSPEGQALSTREGVRLLNLKEDVLVSSCDHGIVLSSEAWSKFIQAPDCDAAIFTVKGFPGAATRPEAFAYVVPDPQEQGKPFPLIKSVSVKRAVSEDPVQDHLLVGTFWFSSAKKLDQLIDQLVTENIRVNNELYLDSVFEVLMKEGRVRMIPLEGYINWGDPESLAEALYWYEIFCARGLHQRPRFPGIERRW